MSASGVEMYRMPVVFGPSGSPRYAPVPEAHCAAAHSHQRLTHYAVVRSTEASLQKVLPAGFSVRGEPMMSWEFVYMTNIHWLAGRGYNMLLVRIPVRWQSPDGQVVRDGWFQPVVWENLCEPILSGREELGWAKLFADLPAPQLSDGTHRMHAAWDGFRFMEMALSDLQPSSAAPVGQGPVLHHKYVPATGAWGEADVDCITVTPVGGTTPRVMAHWETRQAQLQINPARWQDMPTQCQVVNGLHAVTLGEVVRAGIFSSEGGKDLSDQYQLWPATKPTQAAPVRAQLFLFTD